MWTSLSSPCLRDTSYWERRIHSYDVIQCVYPFVYPSMDLIEDPWIQVSFDMRYQLGNMHDC
jgi:hypothetical protein